MREGMKGGVERERMRTRNAPLYVNFCVFKALLYRRLHGHLIVLIQAVSIGSQSPSPYIADS